MAGSVALDRALRLKVGFETGLGIGGVYTGREERSNRRRGTSSGGSWSPILVIANQIPGGFIALLGAEAGEKRESFLLNCDVRYRYVRNSGKK